MAAIEHGRRPLRLTARLLRPRAGIAYSHGIGQESGRSLAQVGAPRGLPPPPHPNGRLCSVASEF